MKLKEEDNLIAKVILFSGLTTLAVSVWAEVLGIEMVTFIILAITGFTFRRCIWKH